MNFCPAGSGPNITLSYYSKDIGVIETEMFEIIVRCRSPALKILVIFVLVREVCCHCRAMAGHFRLADELASCLARSTKLLPNFHEYPIHGRMLHLEMRASEKMQRSEVQSSRSGRSSPTLIP
jgi:hypothetical protein